MAVRLFRHEYDGIVPEMLFWDRSKICICASQQKLAGILPLKSLACRLRNTKDGRFSPIQTGIFSDNLLLLRSKKIKLLQSFKDRGISPEKLLLCKLRALSENSDPRDVGISPEKLLLSKFRTRSCFQGNEHSESSPDKRLPETPRKVEYLLVILQKGSSDPVNLFLARFNTLI